MLTIDGVFGEGGGQIVRSALVIPSESGTEIDYHLVKDHVIHSAFFVRSRVPGVPRKSSLDIHNRQLKDDAVLAFADDSVSLLDCLNGRVVNSFSVERPIGAEPGIRLGCLELPN